MSDWDWVKRVGGRGEILVEIQPNKKAKFPLDFVDNVEVEHYNLPDGMELIPGDICILTVKVTSVKSSTTPCQIRVKVFDVEFVQKSEQRPDPELKEMMEHLEEAKQKSSEVAEKCHYCSHVDSSTELVIKRDLHACAKCGRILTTEEYSDTQNY